MNYIDRFEEGQNGTLILFHGTGGDENQLFRHTPHFAQQWNLLALRGQVSENGALRFFRRFAEGVLDLEDLERRVDEIATHLESKWRELPRPWVGLGYSNGANVVAGLLLRHPALLESGVLWRAMDPLESPAPDLSGKKVLLCGSLTDTITPPEGTTSLSERLARLGANVQIAWNPGGHAIGPVDYKSTRAFLAELS